MIFFINFIYAFLPLSLFYGLMSNIKGFDKEHIKLNFSFYLILICIIFGAIIQRFAILYLYENEAITIFKSLSLFCWLIFFIFVFIRRSKVLFYLVLGATSLDVGASYINSIKDYSLSATSVINTDFITNISYILLGILLVSFLAISIKVLSSHLRNSKFFYFIFVLSILIFMVQRFAAIMLYCFKKDIIELTSTRLSFVAKVTYYDFLVIYLFLALIVLFAIVYAFYNRSIKVDENDSKIQQRKMKYLRIVSARWKNYSIISILLITINLAYYDLYASQPPKLSPSKILKPNENDNFVIDLKGVMDGDLHRFAYITEDGKKVRFFLINRYPDREKVVAVFDACMICGDLGYIKKDNQVICISCGVRIFIPSIGKAGGCNPIPLKFSKKDGKLFISKNEIISGAKYFSEVVEIEVKDPISGTKLINKKAPYNYEYLGKTFYFENAENLDKFRDNPEKYAKNTVKRKWRVEGHQREEGEEK